MPNLSHADEAQAERGQSGFRPQENMRITVMQDRNAVAHVNWPARRAQRPDTGQHAACCAGDSREAGVSAYQPNVEVSRG